MSSAVSPLTNLPPLSTLMLRRFSVDEYHQMIRQRILAEDEAVELIEGWMLELDGQFVGQIQVRELLA